DVHFHDYRIYRGTVVDSTTGSSLLDFCAGTTVSKGVTIAFSAAPGAAVIETVIYERRTEKYEGAAPPHRDDTFWCSDVPQASPDLTGIYSSCIRLADFDPVASILDVKPAGQIYRDGSSTGYALTLRINH